MEKGKSVVVKDEVVDPQQEYDKEWEEAEKAAPQVVIAEEQGLPGTFKKVEREAPEQTQDIPPTQEPVISEDPETGEQKITEINPDAKKFEDTKKWATKLSMENAELKRKQKELEDKLVQFDKGEVGKEDLHAAKVGYENAKTGLNEKIARIAEDYPELTDVLKEIASVATSVQGKMESREQQDQRVAAETKFKTEIEPEIIKIHPDYEQVVKNNLNEYFNWANSDLVSPAIKIAALHSNDPRDICMAIDEFKAYKGSGKLANMKNSDEVKKQNALKNLQSLRGGISPYNLRNSKNDPNDVNGAWEEAGEILKKQGVVK